MEYEELCRRYWDLVAQVQCDPEYARLKAALEALEPEFAVLLAALPEHEQSTLDRYITIRENMGRRMAEFAWNAFHNAHPGSGQMWTEIFRPHSFCFAGR